MQIGDELVEPAQEVRVLVGDRVPDGVGDVDRRRPLIDRDLADLGRELELGSRGIHGRELDVVRVLLGVRHRGSRLALDVLSGGLQLVLDMDVRGRDEGVDPRPGGVADRTPGGVDVGHVGPGQAGDHRAFDRPGNGLHGLEIARRGDREAGLDHVDPEAGQLRGQLSSFSCGLSEIPGDCSPSRRVVSKISTRLGSTGLVMALRPSGSNLASSRCWFRGYVRPPARYSPRGGGEEVEGRGRTPSPQA